MWPDLRSSDIVHVLTGLGKQSSNSIAAPRSLPKDSEHLDYACLTAGEMPLLTALCMRLRAMRIQKDTRHWSILMLTHMRKAGSVVLDVQLLSTGALEQEEMLAAPPDDLIFGMKDGTLAAPPSEPDFGASPALSDGLQALADLGPLSTPGSIRSDHSLQYSPAIGTLHQDTLDCAWLNIHGVKGRSSCCICADQQSSGLLIAHACFLYLRALLTTPWCIDTSQACSDIACMGCRAASPEVPDDEPAARKPPRPARQALKLSKKRRAAKLDVTSSMFARPVSCL